MRCIESLRVELMKMERRFGRNAVQRRAERIETWWVLVREVLMSLDLSTQQQEPERESLNGLENKMLNLTRRSRSHQSCDGGLLKTLTQLRQMRKAGPAPCRSVLRRPDRLRFTHHHILALQMSRLREGRKGRRLLFFLGTYPPRR